MKNRLLRIWFVFAALLFTRVAGASISLTEAQTRELTRLITSEPEVKKVFRKIEREADASLGSNGRPVAHLGTAGRLRDDPEKIQSRASLEDMKKIETLAYAFAVTRKRSLTWPSPEISAAARNGAWPSRLLSGVSGGWIAIISMRSWASSAPNSSFACHTDRTSR